MKLPQTKVQRQLDAVREIEQNLERREKRQRVIGFITAGTVIVAALACLARILHKG